MRSDSQGPEASFEIIHLHVNHILLHEAILTKSIINMSERGHFRGGGRGGARGSRGHDRGGRGGGGHHAAGGQSQEKPKKENILDLTKYLHKQVQVKFNGGREGML